MICKSIAPSPALQEYVRNYTLLHLRFDGGGTVPPKHRPPKPEQGIVFYIRGGVRLHNEATGEQQVPARVALFSHQVDKKIFEVSAEFFMFTIFLHPGVLHRLTGVPAPELKQDYHDAETFFGTGVRLVSEQLAAAPTLADRVRVVESFLLPRFRAMRPGARVDSVADRILADPTGFSLDDIARQACLGTKQFYRRFVERIGISPKFFSRMTRFNQAYHYKLAHPQASWTAVAREFFYTDYHHLEKEFKEFTGLTPNEWILQARAAPERILQLR